MRRPARRSHVIKRSCQVVSLALAISAPKTAAAEPQANTGLTLGVVRRGESSPSDQTRMAMGFRADVLYGRTQTKSWGVGPNLDVATCFDDILLGTGLTTHVPIHDHLPLLLSFDGYLHRRKGEPWAPAAGTRLFWGTRSYNHSSWYVMSAGLFIDYRSTFAETHEHAATIGVHIDGEVIALPFLLLYGALSGPHSK